MANAWLTAVSNMFDWATKEDHPDPLTDNSVPILEANPCDGVKRLKVPKPADPDEESGHPTFTAEDLGKFEATYPEGTLERKAYAVFLYTGFRVGDAARVGPQHVQKDGTIRIKANAISCRSDAAGLYAARALSLSPSHPLAFEAHLGLGVLAEIEERWTMQPPVRRADSGQARIWLRLSPARHCARARRARGRCWLRHPSRTRTGARLPLAHVRRISAAARNPSQDAGRLPRARPAGVSEAGSAPLRAPFREGQRTSISVG